MITLLAGEQELQADQEVRAYLADLLRAPGLHTPALRVVKTSPGSSTSLTEQMFDLLTNRRFCHLSRGAAERYREHTLALLERSVGDTAPVPFWFDIGPGYHASLQPGEAELSFDVGLSELLVLHQVRTFSERFAELHAPGARFILVIDNLCALRTNDVPIERTASYCAQLRALIEEEQLGHLVDLLVESEVFALDEYDCLLDAVDLPTNRDPVSADDLENVERFLGRRCCETEAGLQIDRYLRASAVTEQLLARVVTGVRMTQRAGETTLGFRPFPGGDSRTQCGEVAIGRNEHGKLRPLLLTSRNVDAYECTELVFPDLLPAQVASVTFAEHRSPVS